ncbi:MAG: SDR family NAD(P)-dependent oxidoreductase, partial [Bdellovibrionota bacterium]
MSDQKTVMVTGASRGIGKGLCEEALRRGYRVYAVVRDAARAPAGTEAFVADVRDRKRMAELIHQIADQVDLYIANAGMGENHNPSKPDAAEKAYEVLDLNASATVYSMYKLSYEWISRGLKDRRIAAVASLA